MDATRRRAARLRGLFVGAIAAASAVSGHALGGGALPGGTSIALVALCSAGVGAVAATVDYRRRVVVMLAYVTVGQLIGHYVLEFSGSHHHAHGWSAAMASAHAAAAVLAAVLICAAERLFAALAAVVWQLAVVLLMPGDAPSTRSARVRWHIGALTLRRVVGRGRGMRAPPVLLAD